MDQSKSSNGEQAAVALELPRRKLTVEFYVGIFAAVAVLAGGYLAVGLGGMNLFGGDHYEIVAEFDNISGLQLGASVEIAGVPVGEIVRIGLEDNLAIITMRIHNSVAIRDDDIASVRTKGIIGDRYIKITPGYSETVLKNGDLMTETESVLDIEDLIGKFVHRMDSDG